MAAAAGEGIKITSTELLPKRLRDGRSPPSNEADMATRRRIRNPAELKRLLTLTWQEWNDDQAPRLGAALSYYAVFSLAPLLLVLISIAGLIFGEQAARGQLMGEIQSTVGTEGASAIQSMLENSNKPSAGILASLAGFLMLLFGASSVSKELKASVNLIWKQRASSASGVAGMFKERTTALGVVLACGFLLMVSLVASSVVAALGHFLADVLPLPEAGLQLLTFTSALVVNTGVFALLLKFLPDVKISWSDVLPAAACTAVLFAIGTFLIGIYIGKAGFSSTFGAAGSLVIVLAWVYYSSQIFFFGAELTKVYAREFGSDPVESRASSSAANIDAVPNTRAGRSALPRRAVSGDPAMETDERASGFAGGLLGSALAAARIFRGFRS
jgi:membrane protein